MAVKPTERALDYVERAENDMDSFSSITMIYCTMAILEELAALRQSMDNNSLITNLNG